MGLGSMYGRGLMDTTTTTDIPCCSTIELMVMRRIQRARSGVPAVVDLFGQVTSAAIASIIVVGSSNLFR